MTPNPSEDVEKININDSKSKLLQTTLHKEDESTVKFNVQNRKKLFSSCLSIQAFVGFAGLVLCAQMALTIYNKSVLTSVEKRFGLSSSLAGFFVAAFNIGNLLFVLVVSKYSSTGHRPRIMGIGSLIIALGGFVTFIPHLVNEPYQPSRNTSFSSTTHLAPSSTTQPYLFTILTFGAILQGIGATVLIPLSTSYVDDFSSKENSPFYLGILFVLQTIGPGCGYLIGSWTSAFYVDFDRIPGDEIPVSKDDKDMWVGAWWLGYLIISAWLITVALPLFFFPKSYVSASSDEEQQQNNTEVDNEGTGPKEEIPLTDFNRKTIRDKFILFCKDFWTTVKRLTTNATYMSVILGYSGLMFGVGSTTAFMPKFLEVAFSKSSQSANLTFDLHRRHCNQLRIISPSLCCAPISNMLGFCFDGDDARCRVLFNSKLTVSVSSTPHESRFMMIPSALWILSVGLAVPPTMCVGLLCGGFFIKKFKWQRTGILRYLIGTGILALIPIFLTFFISCETANEVCDRWDKKLKSNISNATLQSVSEVQKCRESECHVASLVFVILTALGAAIGASLVTPIYTVILRSVQTPDKCTAIGLMFLVIRVLGFVPAPIICGAVIDQTCSTWNEIGGERKNCLRYNENQFRSRYLVINFLALLVCVFCNVFGFFTIRRSKWKRDENSSRKLLSTIHRHFTPHRRESSNETNQTPI